MKKVRLKLLIGRSLVLENTMESRPDPYPARLIYRKAGGRVHRQIWGVKQLGLFSVMIDQPLRECFGMGNVPYADMGIGDDLAQPIIGLSGLTFRIGRPLIPVLTGI